MKFKYQTPKIKNRKNQSYQRKFTVSKIIKTVRKTKRIFPPPDVKHKVPHSYRKQYILTTFFLIF